MKHLISFDKLLKRYDAMAESDDPLLAARAKEVLDAQAPYPLLREGFTDVGLLEKYKDVINIILRDSFAEVLTENEIKAASLPYYDIVFNSSKRFQKILKEAGPNFKPLIRNQEDGVDYIMGCSVILAYYYGFHLDFKRPYFYDIPDANGVMHHYRILYNADFMEILPTENTPELTQDDLDELLESP